LVYVHARFRVPEPVALFTPASSTPFYTLSLHDALPILLPNFAPINVLCLQDVKAEKTTTLQTVPNAGKSFWQRTNMSLQNSARGDRKSTRLNSSHVKISYAVFCLKKKMRARYN